MNWNFRSLIMNFVGVCCHHSSTTSSCEEDDDDDDEMMIEDDACEKRGYCILPRSYK